MLSKNSFTKDFRLLNKNDFQNLRFGSRFLVSDVLLFYTKANEHNCTRIGLAISKKVGKANVRNRIKRKLRENFRTSDSKVLNTDILITLNHKLINKKKLELKDIEGRLSDSLISGFKNIEIN